MISLGLSALLPGAGQYYNESYWKIPLIWGTAAWFGYLYYDNDKEYVFYRNRYITTNLPIDKALRDFYHEERDNFAIYLLLLYAANLLDAYVDAHLYDFDVQPDPNFQGAYAISLKLKF